MLHSSYLSDSDEEGLVVAKGGQAQQSYRRNLSLRSPSCRTLLSRSNTVGPNVNNGDGDGDGQKSRRVAAVAPHELETAGCAEGLDGASTYVVKSMQPYTSPASPWTYGNNDPYDDKIVHRDSNCWSKILSSCLCAYFPIINPRSKHIKRWNKFFVFSVLVAIIADPLFLFTLLNQEDNKCIYLDWPSAIPIAIVRSLTDVIYFLHIFLKFRMAYVAPESTVVGAGVLVDQPGKIALRYLRQDFMLDLAVVLPLPQVILWILIPEAPKYTLGNYAKSLLGPAIVVQSIPRIYKFLQLLCSRYGHTFESAWSSFLINIVMYVVAGHVVGACWYILLLQRIQDCLNTTCAASGIPSCQMFMDCGDGSNVDYIFDKMHSWKAYLNDSAIALCFSKDSPIEYGIYAPAIGLSTQPSLVQRYLYALCWGFLQIGTLAGNQITSYYEWEVVFTIVIIGLGLLLFAWLLGNMQNFLQALGKRRLDMEIRQLDVEQWMRHRRLPEPLRRQVRRAERFNWVATRGVNEEGLLKNLPEDIQRDIRRHFFEFGKKIRIFTMMDQPILDAICERLRQKFYIKGSNILYQGGPLEKMFFIVRGRAESVGADGSVVQLSEGDVFGEELLTWHLEHPHVRRGSWHLEHPYGSTGKGRRMHRLYLFSSRTVRCLTNIEAFALRAKDLDEVTLLFPRLLRNPRVQRAIRYESPYWRYVAATQIQVAWRYRQRRLKKKESAISGSKK